MTYTVVVKGASPLDLPRKVTQAHAEAVARCSASGVRLSVSEAAARTGEPVVESDVTDDQETEHDAHCPPVFRTPSRAGKGER